MGFGSGAPSGPAPEDCRLRGPSSDAALRPAHLCRRRQMAVTRDVCKKACMIYNVCLKPRNRDMRRHACLLTYVSRGSHLRPFEGESHADRRRAHGLRAPGGYGKENIARIRSVSRLRSCPRGFARRVIRCGEVEAARDDWAFRRRRRRRNVCSAAAGMWWLGRGAQSSDTSVLARRHALRRPPHL